MKRTTCENWREFSDGLQVWIFLRIILAADISWLDDRSIPRYADSLVEDQDHGQDEQYVEAETRRSQTAWLPSADPVVACVRTRALEFQGFASNDTMDSLAAVKYGAGDEFVLHYDYHFEKPVPVDRRTTFFGILEASPDLVGGSTFFPGVARLAWNSLMPSTWCRFIECGNPDGLFVRAVTGNALFFVNFRSDGTGHEATVHAGAPVVRGTKVGLNIWTYDRMW
jgi:prolyl 4-hydroxylase